MFEAGILATCHPLALWVPVTGSRPAGHPHQGPPGPVCQSGLVGCQRGCEGGAGTTLSCGLCVPPRLALRCSGAPRPWGLCHRRAPAARRFATQDRNALLLYNGRFNERHDFIALEIVEEQVQLTFSAGRPPSSWCCPPGALVLWRPQAAHCPPPLALTPRPGAHRGERLGWWLWCCSVSAAEVPLLPPRWRSHSVARCVGS